MLKQGFARRRLMTLVERSKDVELHGFKITAVEADAAKGQLPSFKAPVVKSAPPVIFLHGLLGQGRMWRQFALNDIISRDRDVFLVDLRNHGESDHHSSMQYQEMAEDLLRFIDRRELDKVTLIGHNIGGKTAMVFTQLFPEKVAGLISLDTAPVASSSDLKEKALASVKQIQSIDIVGKTRKAAIDIINSKYSDKGIAALITNNLAYSDEQNHSTVKWTCNLDAIVSNMDNLTGYPQMPKNTGKTFFLNGTLSVKHPDSVYLDQFQNAKVVGIEGAGHYVHMDRGQTTC
jgi:esterase